jgi:hypothetical protein
MSASPRSPRATRLIFRLRPALFVTFGVMLGLSIAAFSAKPPAEPPTGTDYAAGLQEGVAVSAVAGTLVSAIVFSVIASFRRRWLAIAGATVLAVLAAIHFLRYVSAFPVLTEALWHLAPKIAGHLFLNPLCWLNYFVAYRAYREMVKGRDGRIGPGSNDSQTL